MKEKLDKYIAELVKLQEEIVEQCKLTFGSLFDIDYIYELHDYLGEMIENWEESEIELEYDEDDEDDYNE